MLAGSIAAPLLALALKWLTDAVVSGDATTAALAGVAAAVLAIGLLTLGHFAHIAYFELSELNGLSLDERLIALSNGSAGIEHHERPEYADRLVVLQQELAQIQNAIFTVLALASLGVAIVITGVLLALANPVLLLLPLAAIPPLVTGRAAQAGLDRARDETAENRRLGLHLFRLATTAGPAKELRVFRLQGELRARHTRLWEETTRRLWRAEARAMLLRAVGQLAFAAGYVVAVLVVVSDAIAGHRTVGDVVLAITLSAQVNQQVSAAVGLLTDLQRIARAFARLDWLERYVHDHTPAAGDVAVPDRLRAGIRLEGVRFRYPGTERDVLQRVDLDLPAGSTVAIVGENGAGKTTLVKLLVPVLRADGRAHPGRRRRPHQDAARRMARSDRHRLPGLRALRVRRPPGRRRRRPAEDRRRACRPRRPRPCAERTTWSRDSAAACPRSSASRTRTAPSCRAASGRSSPSAGR